jgi:hypothetical protein
VLATAAPTDEAAAAVVVAALLTAVDTVLKTELDATAGAATTAVATAGCATRLVKGGSSRKGAPPAVLVGLKSVPTHAKTGRYCLVFVEILSRIKPELRECRTKSIA